MRIALAVEGTRGDVHPMLSLGRAFRSLGHDVVLCGPPNFEKTAAECDIDFREVGEDTRAFLDDVASAIRSRGLAANRAQFVYFKQSIERQFSRLPDATRDCDIMLGAGVQLAGPSVADFHGIPYRYVAYCPAMFPSDDYAPPFVPMQGLPRWLNRLAWWFTMGPADALLRFGINRARERYLGMDRIDCAYTNLLSRAPILAADPVLAPVPRDTPIPVTTLGCFHDHEPEALPEKLEQFLAAGPPPVYIGFGSMTDPDPGTTTRLVTQAIEAAGCRALVSQGWAGLGGEALPADVMEIGPVSHAALFPRCAAVVHHGGAGTTTRTAQAGVPQIIVPHLLDQYWWGQRIESMGLAPAPLPRTGLDAPQLASAIRAVVDNEFLADRAREVGEQIAPDPTPVAAARAILDESRI
ncbi:MAG: glycosyltransferase [Myxococcota bacterium]|jgi:UDP:flavonoid glycosyltransferase YjiC (YdhE family)|nr:glycosyltransferase [Myxococcota bacterium]